MKKLLTAAVAACAMFASLSANAVVFGYYLSFTTGSPAAAITAAGHTAQQLNNLTAGDLAGIDVLWILNGSNGSPDANVMANISSVSTFVQGGGVLSFHDRNVNQGPALPTQYIPGAAGVAWTTAFGTDINVLANNLVTNGPAGMITNTTLDGGNFSTHGFASLGSLPAGAVGVLSTGDPNEIVDFYYSYGLGNVYYSAMPLDFYLLPAGSNPPGDAYRNIYAVNEAAFQASLAVPEPASVLLIGLGAGLLALRRRIA
jgi:hypothetical protein